MTNVKPTPPSPAEPPAASSGTATAELEPTLLEVLRRGRPVLLTLRKKKRRRYTKGLRSVQQDLEAQARASSSLLSALAAGSAKYENRARTSARARRDGALRDHWKNSAAALRTTLRKSSKAIHSRGVRDAVLHAIAGAVAAGKKPGSLW